MKKVKYPNLKDYDLSAYEELKGDILYRINGGWAMTQEDRQAMAKAGVALGVGGGIGVNWSKE